MSEKLCLEGEIMVWSQEGGYASPTVQIGEKDLTDEIENFFLQYAGPYNEIGNNVPGQWRVTLERK